MTAVDGLAIMRAGMDDRRRDRSWAWRTMVRVDRPVWPTTARRLELCQSVADLRVLARRRFPTSIFDLVDGAADDEVTMRRNRAAVERVELWSRVLVDVGEVDWGTTLLGGTIDLPIVLAPTGGTRTVHAPGGGHRPGGRPSSPAISAGT